MTLPLAALLVLDLVVCTAWMLFRFRIHRYPSLVGLTFLIALIRYGVMAIPYANDPILQVPIPDTYPYFLAATFTFYVLGATFTSAALRFDIGEAQRRFFSQTDEPSASVNVPVFVALFVTTMIVGIYYATATEQTGIEMLINYGGQERILRAFRTEFSAANPYAYSGFIFTHVVAPMLILVAANTRSKSYTRFLWGAAAATMLGLLVFTSTASLTKSPIIVVMLFVITNRFLARWKGERIKISAILLPLATVLALGTAGYALTYGSNVEDALNDTVSRVTTAPLLSVHGFLYVYPTIVDFAHGMGIGLVARLFNVTNLVTPDAVVGQIIAGPNTSFNSIWSADMWANFGWVGVIVGTMMVGALLTLIDRWCLRRRRTAVSVALYSFMVVSTTNITEASIFTMLLSGGLLTAPALALLLQSRSERRGAGRGAGTQAMHLATAASGSA